MELLGCQLGHSELQGLVSRGRQEGTMEEDGVQGLLQADEAATSQKEN